jgi:hypothetical protein
MLLLALTSFLSLAPASSSTAAAHTIEIRPAALGAHIRFLADDLLEGRETGSRGFDIAARYVASQFQSLGLVPAGDNGSYFQYVRFRTAKTIADQSSMTLTDGSIETTLAPKTDYLLRSNLLVVQSSVTAPVVFAGQGIVAPELGRDDYAGLDVRGKIVMIVTGAPPSFPNTQRAHYSSARVKDDIAIAHGAVGVIILKSLTDEARRPFARSALESGMGSMRRLDPDGRPAETSPQLGGEAAVSVAGAQKLFAHAPLTVERVLEDTDKGINHTFPLGVSITMKTATQLGEARSENVLATLPGSDPVVAREQVVLSAHLDHLGNHPGPDGDAIYNGAFDNATGIACLLEIARAATQLQSQPARSILFAAVTGEEKGEEGSAFLAEHPPFAQPIIADVNMDMFLMLYPVEDLVMFGGEHSTLGDTARPIVEQGGFQLSPDPNPEEVRFIRSDQYSFVRRGIPAITFKAGTKSGDPKIDGEKRSQEWLRTIYHTQKDDLSQPMDLASGARYARVNLLVVLAIADAKERPRWNEGDFFGRLFGGGRPPA